MITSSGIRTARGLLIAIMMLVITLAVGCGGSAEKPGDGQTGSESSAPASGPVASVPEDNEEAAQAPAAPETPFLQQDFKNNKTIHFVSSDPPNNALLSAPPAQVTVRFSSDLGSGSFISVKVDGREVTTGGMILPLDNRSVSVAVNPYAGTGNYAVNYAAYWSDGSYCEGSFGFSVKMP